MRGEWRLDKQDLNTYRTDGLLKSPFRIPDEQLGRMRESLDRLMRDNAHLAPETLICPHIPYGKTHDEAARGLRDPLKHEEKPACFSQFLVHELFWTGFPLRPKRVLHAKRVLRRAAHVGYSRGYPRPLR